MRGFLSPYNCWSGKAFRFLRQGNPNCVPPEPDFICRDNGTGEQIGVEVTTAYYDEAHATSEWKQSRGEETSPYFLKNPDYVENERVLDRVALKIRDKATKRYEAPGKLLLVVLTYSWRLYLSDVQERLDVFELPKSHRFDEIHLASQNEIYQLFPGRKWLFP